MKKTVLITGASKGIGSALASLFTQNNYQVFGTSRMGHSTKSPADKFQILTLDLADSNSINALKNTIQSRKLKLDILINNAAIGPDLDTDTPEEKSLIETFTTNVFGTVLFTEQLIDSLNNDSKIINISSKMGSIGICNGIDSVAYRMSKAALNMYSKILTNRLKERIKVATIHPGWVRTELTKGNAVAPLSKEESANAIFEFIESNFKTGSFWNVLEKREIEW